MMRHMRLCAAFSFLKSSVFVFLKLLSQPSVWEAAGESQKPKRWLSKISQMKAFSVCGTLSSITEEPGNISGDCKHSFRVCAAEVRALVALFNEM